ncbi:MAG: hypothetical protein JOZ10_10715 [Acidobacteria bacterium]|nr:hypothetical protein [Acidobacteriota bacterium]MBV9147821.1 hypothetical protein [Acidobacteriota bacterium]MBV9434735.1 hypothetical protein [Acidobacteriota bacterium]
MTFRWKDAQGREQVGAGFTHDVSAVSIFVFSRDLPPLNGLLHCEVKLPRLRDAGCVPVTVSGRVVRAVTNGNWRQHGFAVLGEMLRLCTEVSGEQSDELEDFASAPTSRVRPN